MNLYNLLEYISNTNIIFYNIILLDTFVTKYTQHSFFY